jgi:hypothetical protein
MNELDATVGCRQLVSDAIARDHEAIDCSRPETTSPLAIAAMVCEYSVSGRSVKVPLPQQCASFSFGDISIWERILSYAWPGKMTQCVQSMETEQYTTYVAYKQHAEHMCRAYMHQRWQESAEQTLALVVNTTHASATALSALRATTEDVHRGQLKNRELTDEVQSAIEGLRSDIENAHKRGQETLAHTQSIERALVELTKLLQETREVGDAMKRDLQQAKAVIDETRAEVVSMQRYVADAFAALFNEEGSLPYRLMMAALFAAALRAYFAVAGLLMHVDVRSWLVPLSVLVWEAFVVMERMDQTQVYRVRALHVLCAVVETWRAFRAVEYHEALVVPKEKERERRRR